MNNRRDGDTEVAKKTHNPVSDLISVPFQNNFNLGGGPNDDVDALIVAAHIPAVDQRAIALSGSCA